MLYEVITNILKKQNPLHPAESYTTPGKQCIVKTNS